MPEPLCRRRATRLELVLLRVQAKLLEAARGAADPEPELLRLRTDDAGLCGREQARVVQVDGAAVLGALDDGALALRVDEAGDGLGDAVEGDDLVEEVGAQVVDDAVAGRRVGFPVGWGREPVAVKVRLEFGDAAKSAAGEEVLESEVVGVPAAVCRSQLESWTVTGWNLGSKAGACSLW